MNQYTFHINLYDLAFLVVIIVGDELSFNKYHQNYERIVQVMQKEKFAINEAAAKYMGMQNPVGETIHWKSKWNNVDKDYRIVGVIKDVVWNCHTTP